MDAQRKQAIQDIFDTVAPGYDHPALAFFPATAERLLAHLQLAPDAHLLDACTGTGRVSLRAARLLTHGQVTGIDLSSGMLEQAREKARAAALGNLTLTQMDLEALTFAPCSFDAATCSFGVFFVDDMTQALRNLAACVKPGGSLAISSFAAGAFEPMSSLFLRRCERFGLETRPAAWLRIATEPALHALFDTAGLATPAVHQLTLQYPLSVEDWWAVVWNAGFRGYLLRLPEAERAAFQQQHQAEIAALIADGQNTYRINVLIAVSRRD